MSDQREIDDDLGTVFPQGLGRGVYETSSNLVAKVVPAIAITVLLAFTVGRDGIAQLISRLVL